MTIEVYISMLNVANNTNKHISVECTKISKQTALNFQEAKCLFFEFAKQHHKPISNIYSQDVLENYKK